MLFLWSTHSKNAKILSMYGSFFLGIMVRFPVHFNSKDCSIKKIKLKFPKKDFPQIW